MTIVIPVWMLWALGVIAYFGIAFAVGFTRDADGTNDSEPVIVQIVIAVAWPVALAWVILKGLFSGFGAWVRMKLKGKR